MALFNLPDFRLRLPARLWPGIVALLCFATLSHAQELTPTQDPIQELLLPLPTKSTAVSEPGALSEPASAFESAVVSEPLTSEPVFSEPEIYEPSTFVVPTPGYWIVSTWSSPQDFDNGTLQFCPDVTRFDDCVGIRRSAMQELTESLVPGVPLCIVVHGSFMDSPSVYPEAHETWNWLRSGSCGLPFQMIYFSWPSDRPLSALASIDVALLGKRASRNGFYLTSLLQQLPPDCPVCLLGHSHGTRVISSSLHLMAGGSVEDHRHLHKGCDGKRIRTVFTASAIDHDWLNPGQRFDRALSSTECLLNLHNHNDPALLIYPFRRIGSSRALGCTGFTEKDRNKLGQRSHRVKDWDVTEVIGVGHLWPNYVKRPSLACNLRNYLYFADQQQSLTAAP